MNFDVNKYSSFIREIYQPGKLNSLGPGQPNLEYENRLREHSIDSLFGDRQIQDRHAAESCLSGLWLHHDFLNESHTLSQSIPTPSGSFWHGIMHRREGDYWNSKYWFRQVGSHPVFTVLAARVIEILNIEPSPIILKEIESNLWDPFLFVDLCEKYYKSRQPEENFLQKIQHAEWQILFNYCYKQAL